LEDPNLNEKIILKYILNKSVVRAWTGFVWVRINTSEGQ
jgi:hypothetical protein